MDKWNGATKFSKTSFSITTLGTNGLFVTLSINDTQHNNTEYCILFIVLYNVVMLIALMLSEIMLYVMMLNVIARMKQHTLDTFAGK